ncbi:MAG: hypothetical protein JNK45_31785 [Myxococcales bacterium]|nr:hypothetical protein [Myxococcales bacterium]
MAKSNNRSIASRRALMCSFGVATALVGCEVSSETDTDTDTDIDPSIGIVSIGPDDGSSDDGSSSDGGSSDDGSSSTGEDVLGCGDAEFSVAAVAPRAVLVLDKSHSMVASTWDHDGDPATAVTTRWSSLHETVADLVSDVDGTMELGAVLFPSRALTDNDAATACEVPDALDVAIASDNGDAILDAMPSADSLEIWGGTPTAAGIATAAAALRALEGDAPRAIILVTDGAANCSADAPAAETFTRYDEDLAPLVASLAADGIPTYVVGIDIVDGWVSVPEANPHDRLGEVALAGGVANPGATPFFDARDEGQLFDALGAITSRIQCTLTLEGLPSAPERVHLSIGDAALAYTPDCDADGWRYADDGAIELCMAACDDFVAAGTVHAAYDCIPEG